MKKNLRFAFTFSMLAAFILSGCKEETIPEIPDEPIHAELNVDETIIEVPAEGGQFSVSYSFSPEVEGEKVNVTSSESWVYDININPEGKITFSVDAWKGEKSRDAKISLSYCDAEDFFAVYQQPVQPEEPEQPEDPEKPEEDYGDIMMVVNSVSEGSVNYTVRPEKLKVGYIAMVVEKASFDAFSSDEEYFQDDMKVFRENAEKNQMSLEQYLFQLIKRGEQTVDVPGLRPGTDYYVYAYGMNEDGERLTDIFKKPFTTTSVEYQDFNFDISYKIEGTLVEMTVTPENHEQYYMYDVALLEEGTEITDQQLIDGMQKYIDQYIALYTSYGVTVEEAISYFAIKGENTYTYNGQLYEEREYIGYAMAITDNGYVCSIPTRKNFKTEKIANSDNVIEITVDKFDDRNAIVSTVTTNDDLYVIGLDLAENWNGKTDEEILKTLEAGYDWKPVDRRGSASASFSGLQPETTYAVFAFGYLGGKATTKLYKAEFTTAASVTADVTMTLLYDKYFDGDELAAMDPSTFGDAKGMAVLPVTLNYTGDVYECFYNSYKGDLSDTEAYPDETIINDLLGYSCWEDHQIFFVPFDEPITLAGFAADYDGNYGPLYREVITLDKNGVSPASEYIPAE